MPIQVGDKIPKATLNVLRDGVQAVDTHELFGGKKVVLFAVPGAFTPGCSEYHLPGFVTRARDLREKGVDKIACISVNDAFVMGAWGKDQQVGDDVQMLADGNGEFAQAMGLVMDGSAAGLGTRSQRYAAILQDGVITELLVEPERGVDVSSANNVISKL